MTYIVKDEQGHPIIHKGSNVVGCDVFEGEEIKDFEDKSKSFLAVASAESPDRFKDCIMVKGWQLKDYRKNAVLLMAHCYSKHPAGRSLEEFADEKKNVKRLMFRPQFHGLDEESRLLYSLYKSKYLAGFSVGFLPLKSEKIEDDKKKEEDEHPFFHTPTRFLKQTLLEISIVPVPAHQDALSEVKSLVKKGSLYIPARYLQEKQVPETEIYDDYIHIKVEDEGRFKALYEDLVGEGIVRVFGSTEDEDFVDHKFIFSRKLFNEEKARELAKVMSKDGYSDDSKDYDSEAYTTRETVLIDAFPVLDENAFAAKEKREELETANNTDTNDADETSVKEEGCEECSDELGREYVVGEDIDFTEEEYIDAEDVEEKPFPNEHACRLLPPGDFDRFARKNCFRRSGGKCIDFIFGIKAGKSKTQAMRYKKDVWTASAARAHCRGADGTFEAAGKMIEEIDAGKKIYVYSTTEIMEEEEVKRIMKSLKQELGEDATVLIVDGGAKLEVLKVGEVTQLTVGSGESAEVENTVDEKTNLEKFKVQVEELWDVKVTDEAAEILMGLSEKMDLDLVKAVLDVSDALLVLKPEKKNDEGLDELDEETISIELALKSQTEEMKKIIEKIIDEVVERVIRAVRAEFKDMKKNEEDIDEDEIIDPDVEDELEDEDLEDDAESIDIEDDDAEEDEIAAVVSDSLKDVLGRLD